MEPTSWLQEPNVSQGAFKQREQHRQPAREPTWSRRSAPSLIPSWSSSVPSMRKASSTLSVWLCCWVCPLSSSLHSFSSAATAASAASGEKAGRKVAPAATGSCTLRGTRRKRKRRGMKKTYGFLLSPSCSCWTRDLPCPSSGQEGIEALSSDMPPVLSALRCKGRRDAKAAATLC